MNFFKISDQKWYLLHGAWKRIERGRFIVSYTVHYPIQSKTITDPFLKLFIVFNENMEERIYKFHPTLKPKNDRRGLKTKINFNNTKNTIPRKKRDSLAKKYIEVFNSMHEVYIDSIKYNIDFLISTNLKKQTGFESYVSTNKLTEGKHLLKIKRKAIEKNDTVLIGYATIPFWYFKQ